MGTELSCSMAPELWVTMKASLLIHAVDSHVSHSAEQVKELQHCSSGESSSCYQRTPWAQVDKCAECWRVVTSTIVQSTFVSNDFAYNSWWQFVQQWPKLISCPEQSPVWLHTSNFGYNDIVNSDYSWVTWFFAPEVSKFFTRNLICDLGPLSHDLFSFVLRDDNNMFRAPLGFGVRDL